MKWKKLIFFPICHVWGSVQKWCILQTIKNKILQLKLINWNKKYHYSKTDISSCLWSIVLQYKVKNVKKKKIIIHTTFLSLAVQFFMAIVYSMCWHAAALENLPDTFLNISHNFHYCAKHYTYWSYMNVNTSWYRLWASVTKLMWLFR